ncbi:MAG: YbhB/YbcL family Raf kinase inhibitor-like protein [Clostridia bacterium]
MKIISFAVIKGVLGDEYGKRGTEFIKDMPTFSMPFSIMDAPKETKTFAFILEDKEAAEGEFVHWICANLKKLSVEEDESKVAKFIQGANSWHEKCGFAKEEASRYGGPAPEDAEHTYVLTVYALDVELDVENGFSKEELMEKVEGHVLAIGKLSGRYAN